ncbi:molybdenum ABC transporter ATP-binding protein [Pelodictyon luteolum]|uniref:Molybdate ABC transporter, ATP-binding protein n=2 Tax=Chlorobium/Pelodictyon group TaxID=274493 RepID=Q3B267_CHLL3|nr:molybdenum ABC transporter ATP-binding protein [Pelodictyon luteolum]ABB24564.1 Molybdate ABC transporter, ATP-binding protein [Pelodictyon luteolum DSM 273]HCD36777.1 molybdenum ABC transporter ATP-binding protein [Chlorobium sp.]
MRLHFDAEKKLGDFTFRAEADIAGQRIGIFGESGSGKSTLAHILSGLMRPDRGEITLDGECMFSSSRRLNLAPRHRRIGLVFQQAMLFPHLSVRSNLFYGYRRCPKALRRADPDELISLLRLDGLLQRGVGNLSGGEKQRVALGRAMLASPRILVMDEPLSALDDALRFQIIPYLKSVSERFQTPCIFISHSVIEMQLMTERILMVKNGTITAETTPDELARQNMATSQRGYVNLLRLSEADIQGGLYSYGWGTGRLLISEGRNGGPSLFELSSRDIILFRKNPEAISARNMLECRVEELFNAEHRVGVVLSSGGERLVAEIVRSAAEELSITPGTQVFAAIKASSFRRLV